MLAECPAWEVQRRTLANIVGEDLSLPAIVRKIVGSGDCWEATVSFCEQVILQKKAAERQRRQEAAAAENAGGDDDGMEADKGKNRQTNDRQNDRQKAKKQTKKIEKVE